LFRWIRLGRIFDPTQIEHLSWMKEFAQAPSTLVFPDFVRVFFSCRPSPDADGQYVSRAAYVDLDRRDLRRIVSISSQPILALGARGTFDEFGTYPVSVIRHEDAVWAYYGGWTRCQSVPFNVAIGAAVSRDDGVSFTKLGAGPVLSYSLNEPFVVSGPKIRRFDGRWYLWYIAGIEWLPDAGRAEPVYRIRMAESDDGLDWRRHDQELIAPRIEANECQASPDVIFSRDTYHMFFCYRYSTDYRNKARGYRLGYAFSKDMRVWTRDDAAVGLDVSPSGWDSEMISYPHVFALDGATYMLYLGNQVGRYGFGLARLEGEL
jgi:hypothetical protein